MNKIGTMNKSGPMNKVGMEKTGSIESGGTRSVTSLKDVGPMNNGISVQMIFSPQNCTLELLDKTLTPDRRSLANKILAQVEDSLRTKASHYNLIIGPRGTGKTHVLAFIRKMLEANTSLQVIRLSEEERGITNLLDFLLACLRAAGIPIETVVSRIRGENRTTPQDAAIDYFCEVTDGRSALIMIENLANLFDGLEESAISDLRGFFQDHPFISVIASSIALFSNSSQADHPFYGFFNIHPLKQLSRNDAREYLLSLAQAQAKDKDDWKLVATLRKRHAQARVNAIYDLTGGNHRLLAMLSIFLSADGLEELVDPFIQMADRELTPYYQQRLDRLSPQQNKLLQAIADHHGKDLNRRSLKGSFLSVNEIANLTFLSPSTVSRQLYDLLAGGYVHRTQEGRESFYELKEPLLRLVLDLKECRDWPLSIIVSLLKNWYDAQELQQLEKIAPEHARCYYQAAYQATLDDMQYAKVDNKAASEVQSDIQSRIQGSQTQGEKLLLEECLKLIQKEVMLEEGLALIQEENYTDALEKFEHLLKIDPQNGATWFYCANSLRLSGHKEESLKAYDQLIEHFCGSEQPWLRESAARAFVNRGISLGTLMRYEEEIGVYDQVVEHFGKDERLELREQVARTLVNKGVALGKLMRYEEEIRVYSQVVEHFGESDWAELQESVARAFVNKGITLGKLMRYEEEIGIYSQVLERFGENDKPEIQKQIARALVNKGIALENLMRYEKGIEVYDQVMERFDRSDRPELQEAIARALVNKGVALGELGRYKEEMSICDQVVEQFSGSVRPGLQEQVANALVNKGIAFGELGRYEEEMSIYDQVVEHFGGSVRPELQEQVARALVNKGFTLGNLMRYEEEIGVYHQVVEHLGESVRPEIQEQIGRALFNKGAALVDLCKYFEALSAFNSVLQIQPEYPNALTGSILALILLKKEDEALNTLSTMLKKIPNSHNARIAVAFGLIGILLQDEKRLKQVIEIYQPDQKSLIAGLTKWVQNQLPLSRSDAEKLEPAYQTLASAFNSIPEAEPTLQIFQAARLDAMGDRKALLSLPIELRQLVERAKEESTEKESKRTESKGAALKGKEPTGKAKLQKKANS